MPARADDFGLLVRELIADEDAIVDDVMDAVAASVPPELRTLVVRECRPHAERLLPLFLRTMSEGARVGQADLAPVIQASRRRAAIDVPASVSLGAIRGAIARFGSIVAGRAGLGRSRALARVLSCAAVFSHDVARAVIAGRRLESSGRRPAPDWVGGLSEDDVAMLGLAATGLTTAEIARRTHYSEQAVGWHFARMMQASGSSNRTALVARAVRHEVVRV